MTESWVIPSSSISASLWVTNCCIWLGMTSGKFRIGVFSISASSVFAAMMPRQFALATAGLSYVEAVRCAGQTCAFQLVAVPLDGYAGFRAAQDWPRRGAFGASGGFAWA